MADLLAAMQALGPSGLLGVGGRGIGAALNARTIRRAGRPTISPGFMMFWARLDGSITTHCA